MSCFQVQQQNNLKQLSVHQDQAARKSISRHRNQHLPARVKRDIPKACSPPPRSHRRDQSQVTINRYPQQQKYKYANNLTLPPSALHNTRSVSLNSSNISCLSPCSVVSAANTAMSQLSALSPAVSPTPSN